jgi:hypothetical protein
MRGCLDYMFNTATVLFIVQFKLQVYVSNFSTKWAKASGRAGRFSRLGPLIYVLKALKLIHVPIVKIAIAEKCLNCMI